MNVIDTLADDAPGGMPQDRVQRQPGRRYRGVHRRPAPLRRRIVGYALAALLIVSVCVVVFECGAHAASTPQCTTEHNWSGNDASLYSKWRTTGYTVTAPSYRYSSGTYTWKCWLDKGSQGLAVYWLQASLVACYGQYPEYGGVKLGINIANDGIYGSQTAAAVKKVQTYLKINPDGVYGPQTAAAMKHHGSTDTSEFENMQLLCHKI